jgi:NADPH2:quinone reductase
VGANIRDFKPGDAVYGRARNGCAEEVLAPTARLYPLPQGVDFVTAASFPNNYSTSFYALRERGRLQPGETVLVLGAAGGVGLAAIDIAKMMGARVIACASTQEKLDTCRRLGADQTINYETENLREAIKRIAGDKGVDVVLDPIGDKYAEPAVRGLAWNGRYLVVGFAAGEIPKIALNLPLLKGASIIGVWSGAYQERHPDKARALLGELAGLIATGKPRPYVSATVPLEGAAGALQSLLTRKAQGKTVVVPGQMAETNVSPAVGGIEGNIPSSLPPS